MIYVPYPLDSPTLVSVIVRGPQGPDAIAPALDKRFASSIQTCRCTS